LTHHNSTSKKGDEDVYILARMRKFAIDELNNCLLNPIKNIDDDEKKAAAFSKYILDYITPKANYAKEKEIADIPQIQINIDSTPPKEDKIENKE
jgi:hypothetical protein